MLSPRAKELSTMIGHGATDFSVWFLNDGGPLLVIPRDLLVEWSGVEKPRDGRVITTSLDADLGEFGGTDYARACAAPDRVSLLPIGNRWVVVLGSHEPVDSARWLYFRAESYAIAVLSFQAQADTDTVFLDAVGRMQVWHDIAPSLHVPCGDLILMHASSPGWSVIDVGERDYATIGYYIAQRVEPGVYAVEEATLTLPDGSVFGLCRFRRT